MRCIQGKPLAALECRVAWLTMVIQFYSGAIPPPTAKRRRSRVFGNPPRQIGVKLGRSHM